MRILTLFIILIISFNLQAQELSGGSGICVVTGNPNSIPDIATVDVKADCTTAYNELTGDRYKYIPTRPLGDRWVIESNGIDTNISGLSVTGGNLQAVEAGDVITIPVIEIAPIQTLAGGTPNVTVTEPIVGSGDWVVNMTETPIQVVQAGNDVTITNEAGTPFTFTLSAAPTTTLVQEGDISITEPTTGTFNIGFTETHIEVDTSVAGQVTITNEDGVAKTFAIASTGVNSIASANDIEVVESPLGSGNYVVSFTETHIDVDTNVPNQVTITNENGDQTTFSTGSGSGTGFTLHGSYKNDVDAANNGCAINEYYETDVDNTLGEPVGTIRRRKN